MSITKLYTRTKSVIIYDPLMDVLRFMIIKAGKTVTSGAPYLIATNHVLNSYDKVFSYFEVDDRNQLVEDPAPVRRVITYITGYSFEKIAEITADIFTANADITITYYKHPDREEYAIPWSGEILKTMMPEPPRMSYEEFYNYAISEGIVKSRTEMLADGWA